MPKVLIVEDDISLSEILEVRLQSEGYQTITAHNGQEGLNMAIGQKPDLIIADIMMPLLSGFDMLKQIKANPATNNIKIVIYTALGSAQDRSFGESLGVARYLVKSQDTITDDLIKAVSEVAPAGKSAPPAEALAPQTLGTPVTASQTPGQGGQNA